MVVSGRHERSKKLLARLLEALTELVRLPIRGLGSTTCKQEDIERGLEPDECWYIRNVDKVRGIRDIDLSRDPPPDLALEVESTCSALDRLEIYAALGVQEVWRYDTYALHIHVLSAGNTVPLRKAPHSPVFPCN